MRISPLVAAVAAALCLPAHADNGVIPSTKPAETLDAVQVHGQRPTPLPQAGNLPDADTLAAGTARSDDSAALLDGFAGIALQGAGGVSALPSLRGLGDDRVRIKVDGMDLVSACGNHMNPPLSYVAPSQIGEVAVFAGITPVSLGGDSIGGTIAVSSEAPRFAEPGQGVMQTGELGLRYRSNGEAFGADAVLNLAGERLAFRYQGAFADAGNYRAGAAFKPAGTAAAGRDVLDGETIGSSAYRSINHRVGLALRLNDQRLSLDYAVQDIPLQGFPNQRMDMTRNDSERLNLAYDGRFGWGTLAARAYRERTRHAMQFGNDKLFWYGPPDGVPGTVCGTAPGCVAAGMPMDTEGRNTGLVLKADVAASERSVLRAGAEWQRYRLDDYWRPSGRMMWPDTMWNIRDGRRERLAAFAEWETAWNARWLTQFGLRRENVRMDAGPVQAYNGMFSPIDAAAFNAAERERSDANLDLTALARFTPSPAHSLEFGLARKTRSPNLYERYAWSTHGMAMRMVNLAGDGNGYVGNLALRPETAHTASVSARWRGGGEDGWQLALTPYLTHVDGYIDAERCVSATPYGMACTAENLSREDGFVYLRFVNAQARLAGIDAEAELPLARSARFGEYRLRALMSAAHAENRDTGDGLHNQMPMNAKLALQRRHGRWTQTLEAELVDAKTDVSAVRNELRTAGYSLWHLRGSYENGGLRVDLGIDNLFDRFYAHPLGGAYLGQGKTMSAGDVPWGVAVPGKGRSLYAGISWRF
ncbi:MAG: TonB-dependent receptor [Arenimonas sp.]|nr:TonB-dependent receptor [Arenimonas sp.]